MATWASDSSIGTCEGLPIAGRRDQIVLADDPTYPIKVFLGDLGHGHDRGGRIPLRQRRHVDEPATATHVRIGEPFIMTVAVGVVLWALTWLTNRGVRAKKTGFRDIEHMEDDVR